MLQSRKFSLSEELLHNYLLIYIENDDGLYSLHYSRKYVKSFCIFISLCLTED